MRGPELRRRFVSRLRTAHVMQVNPPGPIGNLDSPAPGERCLNEGIAQFSGWAVAATGGARVQVRIDGVVACDTVPATPRPDVATVHGDFATYSGWQLGVSLGPIHDGAQWSVEAVSDSGATVLGQGTVSVRADGTAVLPSRVIGHVDAPLDRQFADGPVVEVNGWALDGDQLADVIEIFVNDRPAVLARRCEPRPDVVVTKGEHSVPSGVALAAGFRELVILDDSGDRDSTVITVRAHGRSGAVWHSEPVVVRHARPAPDRPDAGLSPFERDLPSQPTSTSSGRLRVCALTHSLHLGGGELYLQELLLKLADADVADLRVISPADGPLRPELEKAGIAVHVTSPHPVDAAHYYGRRAELAALLQAWSCDVVLANTIGVFPAVDAALQAGIPVAWAVHESFPLQVFSYLNWGVRGLEPEIQERWVQTLRGADTVVFEAESTLELLREQVPGLRGRCIRYGIDLTAIEEYVSAHDRDALRAELGLHPEHRVLLCMGVLQERKAQLALVEAFAEVAASAPDALLVMVGYHPTPYAAFVLDAIEDLGLERRVRVLDIDPDINRWYSCADVLVSASDIESLPRSMLESLAFGVPVLAADVFGVPEVIRDGVNGWLFRSRHGESLVTGLRRVLACSDEELAAMAVRCRDDARQFDSSGYAGEYADLIAELSAGAVR